MQDIIYVGLTIIFFICSALYIRGLDRISRDDAESEQQSASAGVES